MATLEDLYTTTLDYQAFSTQPSPGATSIIIIKMSTPKVFTKYPELPVELQQRIVQEAASSLLEERTNKHCFEPSLGHYACIDSIWKDAIERHTFRHLQIKPRDFEDFGIICGKRHGILHYIELQLHEETDLDVPTQLVINDTVNTHATLSQALGTLMDIMKDWDPKERQRPGLIKVGLDICDYAAPWGPAIHHDFSYLPQVRIIGDLHPIWPGFLHPSSMISLYEKLPNANRVSLRLPLVPEVPGSFQDATGKSKPKPNPHPRCSPPGSDSSPVAVSASCS